MAALGVLKASSSTPNIPATATISAVDRAVLEKMSNSGGSPDRFDLGSSADSLKLKRILHGQASSSASSSSFDSDESSESSAKSRVRVIYVLGCVDFWARNCVKRVRARGQMGDLRN